MEGISKERLIEIKESMPDGTSKLFMHGLITQCQKLQEPWMTLDEFLKSGFVGFCWINQADYIENSYFDGEIFFESSTGSHCYHKYNIELVMPIHKPEPPK